VTPDHDLWLIVYQSMSMNSQKVYVKLIKPSTNRRKVPWIIPF